MMRAIGDQVEKNPEYLSILDKKAIKNGKIDDETQVEQVSVMNKLLNDALRAKGYKGPDIKMVLTDVEDPNGPYYTDTLTNTVVFDRKMLASANRDQILNALGHEFGHYSKEDDIDKSQDIANHTGELLENRTKDMVAKEATEDTLAAIRNNKNVITGEEGKKLADSIPMDRREYVKWGRVLKGIGVGAFGFLRMGFAYATINLGGPIGWGHGTAQGFFGLSETLEGLDHIRLGAMDIDEDEKPAFSLSRAILGDNEEFINLGVAMTTEHAMVYAKAFSSVPTMLKMLGNKYSGYSKLEQGVSKNGIEIAVEDSTAIKTVSNNKNTVTQTGNNSKEVVLYEDKNSKITIDVKDVSIENNETIGSTNSSQQVNKGTTSNNQKGTTGKTVEGKNKTTNTSSYVTGIKEDEPNTFLNGKKFEVIEATEGKIESIKELSTDEGISKLKNKTVEELHEIAKKEGLNPSKREDIDGTGIGEKFKIPNYDGKGKKIIGIRSDSGGTHNMDYIRIDTNQGSTKVIFGDPNKYKYNMTNEEKGRIIFINENKNKKR